MKKTYVKPQLWTEAFQPADAIAGSCTIDVGFGDTGAMKLCAYPDPDVNGMFTLFNAENVCDSLWDDGEDKGCYHIPTDGAGYFGS